MNKRMILPLAMGAAVLVLQAIFIVTLWKPDGIRINYPAANSSSGASFTATGSVWMAPGQEAVDRIELTARRPGDVSAGAVPADEVTVAATRLVVFDRGTPLYSLHLWQAPIELPEHGAWELQAKAWAKDGRSIVSNPRVFTVADVSSRFFQAWDRVHVITFVVCMAVIAGMGIAAARGGESFMRRFAPVYTVVLLTNELAWHLYYFMAESWSIQDNLMLHMCGVAVLLIPVAMAMEPGRARDRLSAFLYFWGIGGAIQALVFPDIGANGFPTYRFFAFFISHALIIGGSLTLAASGRARITIGELARMWVVTNLVMVPMFFIDKYMVLVPPYAPSNYFLLGYPPVMGSVVDLFAAWFGPSPWYIIGFELMGIPVFGLLWLPWAVGRKLAARRAARGSDREPDDLEPAQA